MKRLTLLSLVVLMSLSVSQGATIYDFNNLPAGNLNGATDGPWAWESLSLLKNWVKVAADPNDPTNMWARTASILPEELILVPEDAGNSLFGLSSQDTHFTLSFTGTLSDTSGYMVGLWMDGEDFKPNGSTFLTVERELVVQFGVDWLTGSWRVTGPDGDNDTHSSDLGLPTGEPEWMTVTLDVDLLGNSSDGAVTLTVEDLATHTSYTPYANLALGLLANPDYGDPARYTSWYVQNRQIFAFEGCLPTVYPAILDNLMLTDIPEPAASAILILGGLISLRSRRK